MPNLQDNKTRMDELVKHIKSREGLVLHFYCDGNGYVTLGYGYLVDGKNLVDSAGQIKAKEAATKVAFQVGTGGPAATPQQVADDWLRVKEHFRKTRSGSAKDYAAVARLRITTEGATGLKAADIARRIRTLHDKRPVTRQVDEYIQMALIDAGYNPAGVSLFRDKASGKSNDSFHPDIPKMFDALNRNSPNFNLLTALELFKSIWAGRGGKYKERYAERHALRVEWFKRGVERMMSQPSGKSGPAAAKPATVGNAVTRAAAL